VSHSNELLAVGKRYQFVAWAYLIGFFVPVPFWILHRKWPKLGADYLYTPLIWCVSSLFLVKYTGSDSEVPTMSIVTVLEYFLSASIRPSSRTFPLHVFLNGGYAHGTRAGSLTTITFWPLPSTEELRYRSFISNFITRFKPCCPLQVIVFILTFAVFGASGDAHLFPEWFVLLDSILNLLLLTKFPIPGGGPTKMVYPQCEDFE